MGIQCGEGGLTPEGPALEGREALGDSDNMAGSLGVQATQESPGTGKETPAPCLRAVPGGTHHSNTH